MSSGYDFSQIYHGGVTTYSPGSTFLATAYQDRIIIRSTSTLNIIRTWQCTPKSPSIGTSKQSELQIDYLEWSSDGWYILAFAGKVSTGWVFALTEQGSGEFGELARLDGEGVEGLVKVEWSKSGKEVLAWSEHNLRLTIYSLVNGSASLIQNPKSPSGCHTYSPDQRYFATAERHNGKEHIGVYDTLDNYKLVRHFPLQTSDVQGISWSPCGKWIAVWDSPLSYSIYIHSPIGPLLCHFTPSSPGFSPSSSSQVEDPGLGVRIVTWAPGGRYLAIGGWDGRVSILENEGWRCIAVMAWSGRSSDKQVTVWREPHDWLRETRGRGIIQFDKTPYPTPLPTLRQDLSKIPTPLSGISQITFHPSCTTLLIRLETQPSIIHIHSFLPTSESSHPEIKEIATIIFHGVIKDARWQPNKGSSGTSGREIGIVGGGGEGGEVKLAVVCKDSGAVYFWDREGWVTESESDIEIEGEGDKEGEEGRGGMMEGVGIPSRIDFAPSHIDWSPDGSSLSIRDRNGQFCLLYDDVPPADDHESAATSSLQQYPTGSGMDKLGWNLDEGLSHVSEGDELEDSFVYNTDTDTRKGLLA